MQTVVNSDGRGYGMKLLRWAAMVGLRMGDDEGEDLVDGKGDRKRGVERIEEEEA